MARVARGTALPGTCALSTQGTDGFLLTSPGTEAVVVAASARPRLQSPPAVARVPLEMPVP